MDEGVLPLAARARSAPTLSTHAQHSPHAPLPLQYPPLRSPTVHTSPPASPPLRLRYKRAIDYLEKVTGFDIDGDGTVGGIVPIAVDEMRKEAGAPLGVYLKDIGTAHHSQSTAQPRSRAQPKHSAATQHSAAEAQRSRSTAQSKHSAATWRSHTA